MRAVPAREGPRFDLPSPSGRGAGGEGCEKAPKIKVPVFDIRQLLAKPEQVNAFLAAHAPPVLDPFCGGGSIPLEAQRLGLRAHASDLNPIPVLINKAMIEIPPRFCGLPPVNPEWQKKSKEEKAATVWQDAHGLAEDIRHYGKWMRDEAERQIGHLYPKVKITKAMAKDRPDLTAYTGQELTVIAWLWARTVECPNPGCKSSSPLVSSWNLSSRKSNLAVIVPVIRQGHPLEFRVQVGSSEARPSVIGRKGATCVFCNSPVPFEYIRGQGASGKLGQQLMALVAEGPSGRVFLSPSKSQEQAAQCQQPSVLDTDLPEQGLGFRVQRYGLTKHRDLFSSRQLTAISTFSDVLRDLRPKVVEHATRSGLLAADGTLDQGGRVRGHMRIPFSSTWLWQSVKLPTCALLFATGSQIRST